MTSVASFSVINDTTGRKPWKITYTGVWRKEDEGWKVFLMHNSWE
jgi:ketosteroid isomerase-like protein